LIGLGLGLVSGLAEGTRKKTRTSEPPDKWPWTNTTTFYT